MADPESSSLLMAPIPVPDRKEIDLEAGPGEQFQCRICLETDGVFSTKPSNGVWVFIRSMSWRTLTARALIGVRHPFQLRMFSSLRHLDSCSFTLRVH
ncbi:hypothetical protein GW17_00040951 [Ensete ventricosum]|nr:hypothetical protein GW17_00040951 [Ensete ventricosum]